MGSTLEALAELSLVLFRVLAALALLAAVALLARRLLAAATAGVAAPLALRLAGTAVAGAWLLTISFHLLAALHRFDRIGAAVLTVFAVATGAPAGPRLFRELWAVARWARAPRRRTVLLAVAGVTLVVALRALVLPPIAWDALTYHLVKSGLWVQTGGAELFTAPGGWNVYRHFVAGGEVIWAWVMLPLGTDTLVGVADVAAWLGLGGATALLGVELGLRRVHAWLAAAFVMATPAALLAAGSAYVDNLGQAFAILGVASTLRFLRRWEPAWLLAGGAALGLAAGIKFTALPLVGLLVLSVVIGALRRPHERRRILATGVLAFVLWAAPGLPWIARNQIETGRPLSPYPVQIAGLTLGRNPEFSWYLQQPVAAHATLMDEWRAFASMLNTPLENSLGGFPALPLLLAPLGVAVLWRRSPSAAAVALLLLLHAVAVYSSPQFSVTRLGWSQFNGRYFLLPLALATCLGWLAAGERARAYAGFLAVAVAFDLWVYGALRWSPREVSLLLQHLALLAGTLALVLSVARRGPAWRLGLAVALAAVFVGYGELRRIGERTQLMSEGVSGHVVEKYWIPAARAVDSRREHYRIAVTSGPWQKADNWFLYPFLGSHLQNTLSYVPPSRSGRVLPFAEQVLHPDLDRAAWLERLDRGGIDAVMSFAPPGPELEWMQGDRARFVRITGEDATWGLYLVLRRTAP